MKDDSTVWKHHHCCPLCINGNYDQIYFNFVQETLSILILLFVLCFGVVFHLYIFVVFFVFGCLDFGYICFQLHFNP